MLRTLLLTTFLSLGLAFASPSCTLIEGAPGSEELLDSGQDLLSEVLAATEFTPELYERVGEWLSDVYELETEEELPFDLSLAALLISSIVSGLEEDGGEAE